MVKTHLTRLKVSPTAALDAFLLDGQARRLSPRTLDFYRQELTPFLAYLDVRKVRTLERIDAPAIRAYLVALQERQLAANSQHAAARSIRCWLNFCVREGWLDVSPMRNVRMPKLATVILPAFAKAAVDAILEACGDSENSERDTALVLVLLDTGVRAAELLALNWQDIDAKSGAVAVRRGKGSKGRTVYLGARARKALLRYRLTRGDVAGKEPLFTRLASGQRLKYAGLKELLRRLGRRAGVDDCHAHTFRRTFALWSLRAGMDIYALAQLMGHSDIAILRRYLALVESDLQTAHQQHGAVDSTL